MRYHERMIMLSVLDAQWKDHLRDMDHLKEGIGLRGYGQHDPLVEYKRESFDMFEAMMQRFQEETVRYLYLMQILERAPQACRMLRCLKPGGRRRVPRCRCPAVFGARRQRPSPPRAVATSVDELEEAFQRKKRRELEQARMAGSGERQAVQQVVRGAEKSAATIPAPAAPARSTRNAAAPRADRVFPLVSSFSHKSDSADSKWYLVFPVCI